MAAVNLSGWIMKDHGVPESKLTVIQKDKKVGRKQYWLCRCECGREKVVRSDSIKDGSIKSCGKCAHIQIGERFNKLTVIDIIIGTNTIKRKYKCMCDCGNIIEVESASLRNGHTKSCGCLLTDLYKQNDLTGQRFGKLIVLEYAGPAGKGQGAAYRCKCDCGKTIITRATALRSGHVKSCGCLSSKGELEIITLLQNNNIKFIHNKNYFQDLIGPKNSILRYDFILINDKNKPYRLIEFDGSQHTGDGYEYFDFEKIQIYDKLKNEYAHAHNIPLVRIPYKERDKITLELIMGEKYLV